MSKDILIILEPAVFLLIPLAWAGWEFWAMRGKREGTGGKPPSDRGRG